MILLQIKLVMLCSDYINLERENSRLVFSSSGDAPSDLKRKRRGSSNEN